MALTPSGEAAEDQVDTYIAFFDYMYNNREDYRIDPDGQFVFSYPNYAQRYASIAGAMGSDWQTFRVNSQNKAGHV